MLALVGQGLSNAEIAERLYLSPATAKTHVSRTMLKLRARDRAQLVVIAYESGLVRPGWHGEATPGRASTSAGRPAAWPSRVPRARIQAQGDQRRDAAFWQGLGLQSAGLRHGRQ